MLLLLKHVNEWPAYFETVLGQKHLKQQKADLPPLYVINSG